MNNSILISIHPKHIETIFSGNKFYEYRKVIPKGNVTHLVLYSTSPVMKIVGMVEVTGLVTGSPSKVWKETASGSGITRQFYFQYFGGQKTATAFKLGKVFRLDNPIDLKSLRGTKIPPQSFFYLDNDSVKKINCMEQSNLSKNNMIFMGGVHGVGKSTTCKKIFYPAGYQCVTASSLLASYKEQLEKDKTVVNITRNQEIIVKQIQNRKDVYPRVLLDGHFTILNQSRNIEAIDINVFRDINPTRLILLKDDPNLIAGRLESRDSKKWDIQFVSHFQDQEEIHARRVSGELGIPLETFSNTVHDMKELQRTVHWRYI